MLVLLRHGAYFSVFQMGFVGVDLFFVLSGFLISGLLYTEYQKEGTIDFRRFFVRRGLKIYPAFYAMILATFIVQFAAGKLSTGGAYASEILFMQDYKPSIWPHCWSLGVEEKFYIFLPIFLILLIRFSAGKSNAFKSIPWVFLVIAVSCLFLRAGTVWLTTPESFRSDTIVMAAHNRIDELFFGVLLGYFHYFHRQATENFMRPVANRVGIGLLTFVFLSMCFVSPITGRFFLIFGPTFLYLGFGGLLMLNVYIREIFPRRFAPLLGKLGSACAFVGLYSYSIYLWQGVFGVYATRGLQRFFGIHLHGFAWFAWYVGGCVVFGILMGRLIEFPVLRSRDKFFPGPRLVPVVAGMELEKTSAGQVIADEGQ
jgi:peptidoglycan/LPS O-acetylase OafA/YrhL